jgi:hypothetical protein
MTQESLAADQKFAIGTVLSTSLAVLGRNFATFIGIAVLIGIPYIIVTVIGMGAVPQGPVEGMESGSMSMAVAGMMMVGGLVALLTYVVAQAAINFGTFQDLRGQKAEIGECLRQGLAAMPRVIGAGLLAVLAAAVIMLVISFLAFIPIVGIVIMIVGFAAAIALFINWWVIIPVVVVEKTGVLECFGRSRALTAGNRWRILLLLIVVGLGQGVINFILQMIGQIGGVWLAVILTLAVSLFFIAFNAVLTAVGYYTLRSAKEGIIIDDIARVFD